MNILVDELMTKELIRKIDQVVDDLFEDQQITSPPVDSFKLAEFLQWEVILSGIQQERGRMKQIAGRTTIFLQNDPRPERVQWALAHEIGESLSSHWISLVAEQDLRLQPQLREELANHFATRLLLPEQWFPADAQETDGDLLQLKEIYSTASYQLIATRLLDQEEVSVITIFDEGQQTFRRGNSGAAIPPLQPLEKRCCQETHQTGNPVRLEEQGLIVEAWPVHEPGFKREIVRTRPQELYE